MRNFYTQAWPYTVYVSKPDLISYNAIFEYRWDNQRRQLWINFYWIQLRQQETDSMQQVVNDQNEKRLRSLYEKFCYYERINTNEDDYFQFWNAILHELQTKQEHTLVNEEEKNLDPEIEEAIFITNESIKVHNEILQKVSYINTLKQNYYKKYWTLLDKTKAYLQLIHK